MTHHDEIRFPVPRGVQGATGVDGDAVMGEVDAAIDRFIGDPSTSIGRTRTEGDANEAAPEQWQAVGIGNSDDMAAAARMLDRLNARSAVLRGGRAEGEARVVEQEAAGLDVRCEGGTA